MISRVISPVLFGLATFVFTAGASAQNCPATYDFSGRTFDFYTPDEAQQQHIRLVERNHMNEGVRSLRQGQTSSAVSADLRFVIGIVPNHPEALALLMRMALRDRTDRLPQTAPYTVECWLHRATVFRPGDGEAALIYGVYLARRGRVAAAISELERAEKLKPGDANVDYNLGLMHFEQKDYARAREYAKRAYGAGFPLRGLREKLQKAGQWSE